MNNPGVLKAMDVAAEERKERFKNRYIMEGNWHVKACLGRLGWAVAFLFVRSVKSIEEMWRGVEG